MKPSLDLLKKALKACAKAHGAEFKDWSRDDNQLGIKSESVPVVADVRSICQALYGHCAMIEVGWGYTVVFLDEAKFLDEADENLLRMSLPSGTEL